MLSIRDWDDENNDTDFISTQSTGVYIDMKLSD